MAHPLLRFSHGRQSRRPALDERLNEFDLILNHVGVHDDAVCGIREFVRLDGAATLSRPEVRELLDAAEAQADPPFLSAGGGKLVIRSISEKQRPRK